MGGRGEELQERQVLGPSKSFLKPCQKNKQTGFPCGPVAKNPPCNAGDTGSTPGQGTKIPHAATKTQCRQINK